MQRWEDLCEIGHIFTESKEWETVCSLLSGTIHVPCQPTILGSMHKGPWNSHLQSSTENFTVPKTKVLTRNQGELAVDTAFHSGWSPCWATGPGIHPPLWNNPEFQSERQTQTAQPAPSFAMQIWNSYQSNKSDDFRLLITKEDSQYEPWVAPRPPRTSSVHLHNLRKTKSSLNRNFVSVVCCETHMSRTSKERLSMGPNQSCLILEALSKNLMIGKVFELCSRVKNV